MSGTIRIIGGTWRGRKLPVLNCEGLRPTTDRIKETLFNWLMPIIQNTVCLDCFAGSGSLGFEALSRGAKQVVFIEKNRSIATQLKKNSQLLHGQLLHSNMDTKNSKILNINTLDWLATPAKEQFDLVFIDPPFRQNLAQTAVKLLEKQGWLKPDAYIYIETEQNNTCCQIPANWHLHREKITGQVHSRLFTKTKL